MDTRTQDTGIRRSKRYVYDEREYRCPFCRRGRVVDLPGCPCAICGAVPIRTCRGLKLSKTVEIVKRARLIPGGGREE